MERVPVESSNLRTVAYDPALQKLEIEFQKGGVYEYSGVPPEVYQALLQAPSKGRFFRGEIRERYPYRKIH